MQQNRTIWGRQFFEKNKRLGRWPSALIFDDCCFDFAVLWQKIWGSNKGPMGPKPCYLHGFAQVATGPQIPHFMGPKGARQGACLPTYEPKRDPKGPLICWSPQSLHGCQVLQYFFLLPDVANYLFEKRDNYQSQTTVYSSSHITA